MKYYWISLGKTSQTLVLPRHFPVFLTWSLARGQKSKVQRGTKLLTTKVQLVKQHKQQQEDHQQLSSLYATTEIEIEIGYMHQPPYSVSKQIFLKNFNVKFLGLHFTPLDTRNCSGHNASYFIFFSINQQDIPNPPPSIYLFGWCSAPCHLSTKLKPKHTN